MHFFILVVVFSVVGCDSAAVDPIHPDPSQSVPPASKSVQTPKDLFRVGPLTQKMPTPGPNDWLSSHYEKGQTFGQFKYSRQRRTPDVQRNVIYLQPIGEQLEWAPTQVELRTFVAAFFQMDVRVLDPMSTEGLTARRHGPWKMQLLTGSILERLEKNVPDDAFCVLGYTMNDLYPDDDWNFVYGMATFERRVGVFSFIRHVPGTPGQPVKPEDRNTMLIQSFKTLSHEIGHMFGIHHCIAHHCGMNGMNNKDEALQAPLNFCPVCQRKLQSAVGYDVVGRNEMLHKHLKHIANDSAGYYQKRNEWIAKKNLD